MSIKYCGSKHCSTSTGECGSITHGMGEPDVSGYFDLPCFVCARYYEKLNQIEGSPYGKHGQHWPFAKPIVDPEDLRRKVFADTEHMIKETLMDEGTMHVHDLHRIVLTRVPHAPFDEVFCSLIGFGKMQLIFYPDDAVLASITPRTRMPKDKVIS